MNSSFGYVYENVLIGSGSVLQYIFLDKSTEQITLATSSDQGSQVGKVLMCEYASTKDLEKLVRAWLGLLLFIFYTCTLLKLKIEHFWGFDDFCCGGGGGWGGGGVCDLSPL